jgi:hypothetical protein
VSRDEFEGALPGLYEAFVAAVRDLIAQGHRRVSARGIVHALRVEAAARGRLWKINDHTSPLLARLAIAEFPEWEGFFELRESRFDGPRDHRQPELFGAGA